MKNQLNLLFMTILLGIFFIACDSLSKNTSSESETKENVIADEKEIALPISLGAIENDDGSIQAYAGKKLYDKPNNLENHPDTNIDDGQGGEIPYTLPISPETTGSLLYGEPSITESNNQLSPSGDIQTCLDFFKTARNPSKYSKLEKIQFMIDILEGRPINDTIGNNCYNIYGGPCRYYNGMPLLHYNGPEKIKKVTKLIQANVHQGESIDYNVTVHQIWFDNHIESNTNMLDLEAVQDVPWTITYVIDALGPVKDGFKPVGVYVDANGKAHVSVEQTAIPLKEGERVVAKVKMPPAKYLQSVYAKGSKMNIVQLQAMENKNKQFADPSKDNQSTSLDAIAANVFGTTPSLNQSTREKAISKIGDLSPAKQMWNALRNAKEMTLNNEDPKAELAKIQSALNAWKNPRQLPDPSLIDQSTDLTLLYVNNTIYGGFSKNKNVDLQNWKSQLKEIKITLLNGDHFWHAYQCVDFGAAGDMMFRYEGIYQDSTALTRAYWSEIFGEDFVKIPPATDELTPSSQKVTIPVDYKHPSELHLYQYDPYHHDVAIFPIQ